MPDHILHPKFKQPRKGKGCWISIHAGILEHARKRGVYKMVSNAALMLPSTRELVGKQLEERVVQELQLLESHFAHGRNGPFTPKRRTRRRSKSPTMQATQHIPSSTRLHRRIAQSRIQTSLGQDRTHVRYKHIGGAQIASHHTARCGSVPPAALDFLSACASLNLTFLSICCCI